MMLVRLTSMDRIQLLFRNPPTSSRTHGLEPNFLPSFLNIVFSSNKEKRGTELVQTYPLYLRESRSDRFKIAFLQLVLVQVLVPVFIKKVQPRK